jgi:hypothetical protein
MTIQTNGDDCRESGTGETSRQQFEALAKSEGLICDSFGIRSVNEQFLNACWKFWQAGRASIEIIPPKFIDNREALSKGFMVDYSNGYGDAMDAYEERLKEAGITVKEDT